MCRLTEQLMTRKRQGCQTRTFSRQKQDMDSLIPWYYSPCAEGSPREQTSGSGLDYTFSAKPDSSSLGVPPRA
jgi:hypothetical protein